MRSLMVGMLGLFLVVLGTACQSRQASSTDAPVLDRVTLQLHWKCSGPHVPFIVASEKGFFEEEGIDITIREGSGSSATSKLIAAGSATFGVAATNVSVKGTALGMPIVQVMQIQASRRYCILSRPETGIRTPQDLIGKVIAGSGGGGTSALFNAFLAANEIPKEQVTFLNAGRAMLEAMATGRADGALGLEVDDLVRLQGMDVDPAQVMLFEDWGIPVIGDGVIVNTETARENPDLIRRFIRAYIAGVGETFADIDAAAEIAVKRFPLARKEILVGQLTSVRSLLPSPLGYQDPEALEELRRITVEFDGVAEAADIPLTQLFTNEFLPE
jgi:NitT/TauT family transport system substrate-binding protein